MSSTMVTVPSARPDVLPTDRLLANGMGVPDVRRDLRRIDDRRNARSVAGLWAWVVAVVGVAVWVDNPFLYAAAFVAMGPLYVRFAILMHEAAHKLLFTNKRVNDWVGTWLIAYPAFIPIGLYRRGHFAHHRAEFRAGRPGPGLLRRLSLRPGDVAPPLGPRCAGHLRVEELRPAPRAVRPGRRAASPCRSSASRSSCGPPRGWPPGVGGSTRSCGGCRG